MKLYKFRPLITCKNFDRVLSIIEDGFYCCNFLEFNDVNEGVFLASKNSSGVTLAKKLKYGICSFSKEKALKSQLMWGHYAGAGMGVAIEIEVSTDENNFKEVKYGETNRFSTVEEILTNKGIDWEYEKEVRYLINTEKKYYKNKITKIYYGTPYEKLTNFSEITKKHRFLNKFHKLSHCLRGECSKKGIEYQAYQFY